MAGNVFGKMFRVTTFGESHGTAVGAVIDGCPAGVSLDVSDIQKELDRRKPGQSSVTTQRKEDDRAEILSGVLEGKTLGTPIAVVVYNRGQRPSDYSGLRDVFRPGTADFTYQSKYGVRDFRGGGRASGRETLARVASGAVAKKVLALKRVKVTGHTTEVAGVRAESFDESQIEANPVRCADPKAAVLMEEKIALASAKGDSVGGIVEVIARNVPAGLGEPVFEKLDALLAGALMSIGAVKGVEVGDGFALAGVSGSFCNDAFVRKGGRLRRRTNHAGGIEGGISNGEDVVVRIAVKPTPSVSCEQAGADARGRERKIKIEGRHDPCICPRIVPVAEAMVALVLADQMLAAKAARADWI